MSDWLWHAFVNIGTIVYVVTLPLQLMTLLFLVHPITLPVYLGIWVYIALRVERKRIMPQLRSSGWIEKAERERKKTKPLP